MTPAPAMESTLGASDQRKVSVAQVLVYELRVRDAMSKAPVIAGPHTTLREIQHLMKKHRFSGVPIVENGALVGIISIEDIIRALDQGYIGDQAKRWMTSTVLTLRDHFSLVRAVAEFDRHGYGRFPVLDPGGQLVGIITRGDVTTCVMHNLERRAEEAVAREAALTAATVGDSTAAKPIVVKAQIKAGDFDHAGRVSQRMRVVLRARGIDPDVRRRAQIVAYEAETNIIIHSIGGKIVCTIYPDKVAIIAEDEGPGIENTSLAMREGWSTAGPLARELGFGAGMGLPNIKKCSDKFEIQSAMGRGTRLSAEIHLRKAGGIL